MSGTISTNGGLSGIRRLPWPVKLRLAGAAVLVLLLAGVIVWIKQSTWQRVRQVQGEFAAIQTESFYLGIYLRGGIHKLNGMLLRYQLSREPEEREDFHREARELSEWISKIQVQLTTLKEQEIAHRVEAAFKDYLAATTPLLERTLKTVRRDSSALVYQQIVEKSGPVLQLCEELVQAQHLALAQCFTSSQTALGSLHHLLQLSSLVFFLLVAVIAALIYRITVVPLRFKLTQTQVAIERQEKLASLGVLAAGVAHEIRNPLTAIKFRLFSFKKELPDMLADHEDLTVIRNEINRLERIVQDFLQFARPSEPILAEVPANSILQEVYDLLHAQLQKQGIELKLDLADAMQVRVDKQQIQQVLINLIQNAADSIGQTGTISLRTRSGVAALASQSTPVVILEVADTGKGIPPEAEKRIFDPFFSTKEGGTGLGLPIAARITEKHGGALQYQSQINKGTTFSLVLPKISNYVNETAAH